jgi:excisionase family DNA binding protein
MIADSSTHPFPQSALDVSAAPLLDVKAVALLLDCSTRHVRRLADYGQLPPPVKLGALVRWRRSDIDTWIANGCKRIGAASKGASNE